MAEKKEARNWMSTETNEFFSILVDPVNRFMTTLENKAQKMRLLK